MRSLVSFITFALCVAPFAGCSSTITAHDTAADAAVVEASVPASGKPVIADASQPPVDGAAPPNPADGGSIVPIDAGAPQDRCARYGAHVAACYNGSVSYYTGWCEWFLKGCSDAHIDQCVASACSDVKVYCGYC